MAVDQITEVMVSLLGCATDALTPDPEDEDQEARLVRPGRLILSPGVLPAWDDCCDGQLWVRLVSMQPIEDPRGRSHGCGPPMWEATIGVGVIRCAAVVDNNGKAPTAEAVTTDTLFMLDDMLALMGAIQCCDYGPNLSRFMGGWTPLGPDGGCVGGEWLLTIRFPSCGCIDQE